MSMEADVQSVARCLAGKFLLNCFHLSEATKCAYARCTASYATKQYGSEQTKLKQNMMIRGNTSGNGDAMNLAI